MVNESTSMHQFILIYRTAQFCSIGAVLIMGIRKLSSLKATRFSLIIGAAAVDKIREFNWGLAGRLRFLAHLMDPEYFNGPVQIIAKFQRQISTAFLKMGSTNHSNENG